MPPQHPSASALLRELNGHNSFFDELVNMFPAKLYIAGNSGESYQQWEKNERRISICLNTSSILFAPPFDIYYRDANLFICLKCAYVGRMI